MRALVLFVLVVVSFLLFVRFYPASSVEGGDGVEPVSNAAPLEVEVPPAVPEPDAQARFLTRDRPVEERQGRPEATVPGPKEGAVTTPDWLDGVEPPASRDEGEVEVAAALLHGSAGDVRATVARIEGFPSDRARMAEAFAMALDGEGRAALGLATELDEAGLSAREKALLQAALGGESTPVQRIEAGLTESPLVLAMEMSMLELAAAEALGGRGYEKAARAYSDLLLGELDAPWSASREKLAEWTKGLDAAQVHHRWDPKGNWPAVEMAVPPNGTAIGIRKAYLADHPGRVMCAGLILQSNRVRGYLQVDQLLRIPTDPVRMLVDLSARWTLYLAGDEVAGAWPVGIGRPGEETITGEFVAGNKLVDPPWMPIGREVIPFGDPRNPLGTRWIGWFDEGVKTSFGFHGTKEPESIGTASSDGCIRFHNENVERLFEILPEGAPIRVRE